MASDRSNTGNIRVSGDSQNQTTRDTRYFQKERSIIQIDEAVLLQHLNDYEKQLLEKADWKTPLSVALSMVGVMFTTDFRDVTVLGRDLPASTLQAIAIISAFIATWYLAKAIFSNWKTRKLDPQTLMSEIKSGSLTIETTQSELDLSFLFLPDIDTHNRAGTLANPIRTHRNRAREAVEQQVRSNIAKGRDG